MAGRDWVGIVYAGHPLKTVWKSKVRRCGRNPKTEDYLPKQPPAANQLNSLSKNDAAASTRETSARPWVVNLADTLIIERPARSNVTEPGGRYDAAHGVTCRPVAELFDALGVGVTAGFSLS